MDKECASAVSRRGLLRGVGAVGVASTAIGAAGISTGAASGSAATAVEPAGPVVVHLRDLARGSLDVFSGTSHALVTDRDLAARLARLASAERS
jgi:hypothetical protein